MKRRSFQRCLTISGICITIGLSNAEWAVAQGKNEFGSGVKNRRTVSPYLSTLDNGSGNGALNYFNIVTPQRRGQNAAQNLQNEIQAVQSNLQSSQRPGAPTASIPITTGRMAPTGHASSFGDVKTYFPGSAAGGKRQ